MLMSETQLTASESALIAVKQKNRRKAQPGVYVGKRSIETVGLSDSLNSLLCTCLWERWTRIFAWKCVQLKTSEKSDFYTVEL
jgi:hypothetical protein